MKSVISPLSPDQQGPEGTKLADALEVFVEQARIPVSDPARLEVLNRLNAERAAELYGEVTGRLVVLFRVVFGWSDLPVGDEPSAATMNALLRDLGTLDDLRPFVVRGQVRRADRLPFGDRRIRAFDVD